MNYNTIAQPWNQPSQPNVVLPTPPNQSFFMKHNPRLWDFEAIETTSGKKKTTKWMWLPKIDTEYERAGVDGIRISGRTVDSSLRKAQLTRDGWNILEPSTHDYLRVYPCRGGKFYENKWTTLENIAGQMISTFDRVEFNHWRVTLMADGVLKLPHPNILRRIVIGQRRSIDRYVRQQHIPELAAKLKSIQKLVDDMNAAIEAITNEGVKVYEIKA